MVRVILPFSRLGLVAAGALPVRAQDAALAGNKEEASRLDKETTGQPAWKITPSVSIDSTYTDNVLLQANKQSDFVTRLNPALKVDSRTARYEGSINLQWSKFYYADHTAPDALQKNFSGRGKLEAVENWLFIEANHSTSQQPASVFGTQSTSKLPNTSNGTETASTSFSPYIQGKVAGFAEYKMRYTQTKTTSVSGSLAGSNGTTSSAWNGRIGGDTPLALFGWAVTTDSQIMTLVNGAESRNDRTLATLIFQADPQWKFMLSKGLESDNFSTLGKSTTKPSSGIRMEWAPTERTQVVAAKDRRAYGDGHTFSLDHRTALSAWKFSDTREVRSMPPTLAQAQNGTIYDLMFTQLTSQIKDPVERAEAVTRQLERQGLPSDAPVYSQLMTARAFMQRRQQASMALMGSSNTVTFTFDRSLSNSVGVGTGVVDDFTQNSAIRQSGFNTNWAHKLSPLAALTVNARVSKTQGSAGQASKMQALTAQYTTSLGPNSRASAGVRRTRTDGTNSYDETAVTASLMHTF